VAAIDASEKEEFSKAAGSNKKTQIELPPSFR
jgi:hypothetical protein